jgi:hypothetical protein
MINYCERELMKKNLVIVTNDGPCYCEDPSEIVLCPLPSA